ncbi:MAG: BamA/TamA family outer membrane protein [Saprospiraceae bacterium]|nr:BamA/TamA family outer membrane protein [Saprospiraceae bacterium]
MLLFATTLLGQPRLHAQTDSLLPPHKRLDLFPAISSAPETKLTLGAIGIAYLDFRKGDPGTPLSTVEFLAVYTLAKQVLVESRWEVFSHQRRWRTRGEALFQKYPDRNYGIGNKASALVAELDKNGAWDTLNYLNFNSNRIKCSPVLLRKIRPNLYAGLQADVEYLYRYRVLPKAYAFVSADSGAIQQVPVAGLRAGLGVQILYDTRDHVLNPLTGTLVEVNTRHYGNWLGSDFSFNQYSLEVRQYLNPRSNQTLALRAVLSLEDTPTGVPLRALSRVGGHKFIRGYFKGTYQDLHLLSFESEYRLPLWKPEEQSKIWQVWKRLGLVGFVSGAQVFHAGQGIAFDRFNVAAGAGLRILLNKASRINVRIDYAVALSKDSGGPGKRQKGLYFFLGEAF